MLKNTRMFVLTIGVLGVASAAWAAGDHGAGDTKPAATMEEGGMSGMMKMMDRMGSMMDRCDEMMSAKTGHMESMPKNSDSESNG